VPCVCASVSPSPASAVVIVRIDGLELACSHALCVVAARAHAARRPGCHQRSCRPDKGSSGARAPQGGPDAADPRGGGFGEGGSRLPVRLPAGGHINSQNLSRALDWRQWRHEVKTFARDEEPLRWHDLHHTAAVSFLRAGLSAPDVQALMGHSTLLGTQQYADTRREAARRATPLMSQFFAQPDIQLRGGESAANSASDLVI